MSTATFHPARLKGSAAVPLAKSEAHRAVLLAALGQEPCCLHGFTPPLCDDTIAMINGVKALGAKAEVRGDTLLVIPAPPPQKNAPMVTCCVKACAAALRMLIPAFLVRGQSVCFQMTEGLFNRPLDAFEPLLRQLGGTMERRAGENGELCIVAVSGTMPAGEYAIDGSRSSQFASGMLIALACAVNAKGRPAQSFLTITGEIVSRPYLDMTLQLMKRFGVRYTEREDGVFTLQSGRSGASVDVAVTGDWSQAAVLLCANAMGSGIMVQNVLQNGESCMQGDAEVMQILERMGLKMLSCHGELYAVCPSRAGLMPARIDCTNIPDIAPILALTCTQACGRSTLTGVKRLTIKECDRLTATVDLLTRMGAKIEASEDRDTLKVEGPCKLHGGFEADAMGDHRMVMLLAAAALIADKPITVHGVEALNKSWPGFLDTYQALGGTVS